MDSLYKGTGGHNYIQDEDNEDTTHQNHIEEIVEELSILSMERISPYTATTRDFKASAMEIVKAYGDQRAEEERERVFEEMKEFTFEACPYEGTMMRAFINNYPHPRNPEELSN